MKPIVRVENLSKQYRLGERDAAYGTLRETIIDAMRLPWKLLRRQNGNASADKTIWALKDVNFDVKPGDVVGIIGRNGAGKSTLLKILSRITDPTTGRIEMYGRVGSLLEVGTGFHAELSGRENVFLNGAILGMSRGEIMRKFDEIVAFAEVEKFIDTPVKRYSSGMYVRLAFAVAAYLEPEILLVDEVLAVGDAEFQKRCLGKLNDVAAEGRTVLFVSHNMAAIHALCKEAILFHQGRLVKKGPVHQVVLDYLQSGLLQLGERVWTDSKVAPGDHVVRLCAVRALNAQGQVVSEIKVTESFSIDVEFLVLSRDYSLHVGIYFYNEAGTMLFFVADFQDTKWNNYPRPVGVNHSICHIPSNLLNEGTISITVGIAALSTGAHAIEHDVITIQVVDDFQSREYYKGEWPGGALRPLLNWTFNHEQE